MTVGNCMVTGVTQISADAVIQALPGCTSERTDEADAVQTAAGLERALRNNGAFAAKVYPSWDEPTQRITLTVIEGRLAADGIVLGSSSPRVDDKIIMSQLQNILVPGSTLTARKYERAILLTNDLPGVGGSESVLFPADTVGEAKFELHPAEGKLVDGHAYYDNFGSSYTGRNRFGASLDINSPFHAGEKFSVGANATDEGSVFGYLDGSMPLFVSGLRAGFTVDSLDYKTNEPNNLRGTSDHISAYLTYPFIRSRQLNLQGELRYGRESMEDKTDLSTVTDRVVDASSFKLSGDYADGLWGGGLNTMELDLVFGNLDLSGYAPYELEDAQTAKTEGQFARFSWTLSRLQHLTGNWQSLLEFAGQAASKRLDGSQAIAFGGAHDFPGYYSGEVLGDEGRRLHWDLRYNVPNPWLGGQQQWSVFYGYGWIQTHAKDIVGGLIVPGIDEESYTLQSAGLGFSQIFSTFQVQAAVGWRINNEIPDALLDGSPNDKLHGWIQLVYNF
ncbi:ShlB/FhaC/HecB family hemolysin secretion/activation protein [Oceanicoccus sp. KOV_DT_Chl]|uniref:ShlB/FhaC/HecB family hemolysin secretion/activation protein n=1 Tax=Oceanicoccus sp. KOV_DT_Chl TaxID=1904639 RepID=UPI000C7E5E78|nr:ShlB/FhaC/HecB family hemolysin secretion/activation protein [Oceanicoccus sp. KOV_DT_Chl]